jgi:hypothetical protein
MSPLFKILIPAVVLALLFTQCERETDPNDPVQIPDQSFLGALLEPGVDENGDPQIIDINADGKISYAEAEPITFLDVSDKGISGSPNIYFTANCLQ